MSSSETQTGTRPGGEPAVSHTSEDGRREPVRDHLREVAEMAAAFAEPFGAAGWAYAAGMAHDIGKYSEAFQDHILRDGPKVDHSTAGALLMADDIHLPLLAYCVAGHHAGLPDGGTPVDDSVTLCGRLQKARSGGIPDCGRYQDEIAIKPPEPPELLHHPPASREDQAFSLAFLVRMVFSCLVDADFLCTERFMSGGSRPALLSDSLPALRDRLEERLARFYPPRTDLNRRRCGVLDDCLRTARDSTGIYTLTAPTGSGKTYALMRFALQHACDHGMARVICAEPYTSIIEQNAQVYRDVLGDENVLEHQANFDFDASELVVDGIGARLRLASENWDAPVIVTTNVQLFESLFANRTSRCRKLHNIANSVIVLDEAQMIPTQFLAPCVKALAELVENYGCTVVLSSATQPALERFFKDDGHAVTEIVSDLDSLFDDLKRVTYRSLGPVEDEELAGRLAAHEQALCIVNSRRQARALFDLLQPRVDSSTLFHLTTLMYPAHRQEALSQIRGRLAAGRPCVVVATSLVEAGVDLDFPTVYRAVAGVDSMVQAAGRCNRENRRVASDSVVYLFENATRYGLPAEVRQRAAVARVVLPGLEARDADVSATDALDTVASFFSNLYTVKGSEGLDRERIVPVLSDWLRPGFPCIDFADVAWRFKLIEDGSFPVIVPVDEVARDVQLLELGIASRASMRRISRYTVSLYEHDIRALADSGAIRAVAQGTYVLDDLRRYRSETGLDTTVAGGEALFW